MEYNKTLSRSEARHRYWHIYKAERDFFPKSGEIFVLSFHNVQYQMKVNHKDDIMTGKLYNKYRFLEGDRITVTKNEKREYVLDAPDTRPYD